MIYKDCDIGSAKPSLEILKKYPHHLINEETLENIFTVSDFCKESFRLIERIHANNKIPLFVGGSMMYFKSLFYGIHDLPGKDQDYRNELNNLKNNNSKNYLHSLLKDIDPSYAGKIEENDHIRIIRALEIFKQSKIKMSDILKDRPKTGIKNNFDVHQFGIHLEREIIHERIKTRLMDMFDQGLIEETKDILEKFDISNDHPIRKAVNYKQVIEFTEGKYPKEILIDKSLYATRQLAKRQDTWMRGWVEYSKLIDGDKKPIRNTIKNIISSL
tara:strand:- start:814 stop:1632 length:819 start_codon:yes stop_codon:yes gene_type:complete